MRLGDLDALREQFEMSPNLVGPYAVDILDAAPTVECRACEYWDEKYAETVGTATFSICGQKAALREHKGCVRPSYWLCPCFRGRQP